ncbi:MAG: A/G-specific adenine glycosylase [Pseudomonadota bacterium]
MEQRTAPLPPIPSASVAATLLPWYDRHARKLPWRAPPGQERMDPYRVWLSEIMLQQTTVTTVKPYFEAFLQRWPTIQGLAEAPLDDVLTAWAGLGYYARARNLHRCAREVTEKWGGQFPDTEAELIKLPGVGAYTAAAIAAIAFDRVATVVDGNVERVVARLFALQTPLPDVKSEIRLRAASLTPDRRPGDYAQAMMDLGATICVPKGPKCILCPVRECCSGHRQGIAEQLPRRRPKAQKPTRYAGALFAMDQAGAIWLRRRPENGLLGGMMEVPSTDWVGEAPSEETVRAIAPTGPTWHKVPGLVRHTFTHFHFEVTLWCGVAKNKADFNSGKWVLPDALSDEALPTVMRKIIEHGLKQTL